MKKIIITAVISTMLALTASNSVKAQQHTEATPVYVWTEGSGNVDIYDGIPDFEMPDNYHIEITTGVVTDNKHNGKVLTSTDGVTPGYDYICYRAIPAVKGQKVTTILIYECDESGWWDDNIIYRYDMIQEN